MPLVTGTVRCIHVGDIAAFTTIEETSGDTETFILWFAPGLGGIPDELTSFTRIMHSMWISLLRDAHTNGLRVTVVHPSGSAEVLGLRLGVL
jgi:hypothetical protein